MTNSEYNDMSCRMEKASKIKQEITVLEDLIFCANSIKISSSVPGPIYKLTDEEQQQFVLWANRKIQKLKQQFKEL